ncbi:arginine--tRNA ligase [Magnetococcales bacterium HHB-1]
MANIRTLLEQRFRESIQHCFGEEVLSLSPLSQNALVFPCANRKFGDFQINAAMALAKRLRKNPRSIATEIVNQATIDDLCEPPQLAGPGFINIRLKSQVINQALTQRWQEQEPEKRETTIVIDYSSPNIAKEMHVGHLRSTVIGDVIARVFDYLGFKVIRQNHMGDWGTQFGMLIEYLIEEAGDQAKDYAVSDLDELYQAAKRRADEDEAFAKKARERVVLLQAGEENSRAIWQQLIAESQRHFDVIYQRLGISLQKKDTRPESFYNDQLASVITDLRQKQLATEDQGAQVVALEGFKDKNDRPIPMIIQKSDGGYLYATTDLAAARYRFEQLNAERLIYVTDARQAQHFAMLFQCLEKSGWIPENGRLDHVPFGMVLGKDRKPFQTRDGGTIKLAALLDEAIKRAETLLQEKNPTLEENERQQIAEAVGIGAIKYADLSSQRIKDYVFDWNQMLSFEGNTAPYLQNAYVRIRALFRKGEIDESSLDINHLSVEQSTERLLALLILSFEEVIEGVSESLEPHRLCGYLYELAGTFHRFYEQCPVLKAETTEIKQSRLVLCHLTADTLRKGLEILGVPVLEQM